ncbi:MAG: 50S ribosomal protein L25 [Candidatus Auribacterota bacterium]|nr:50S ribosomal protein L25 [Candidatus Auribacterota bacterium]
MADVHLDVKVREKRGTGGARSTRRNGYIPAVIYAHGEEPLLIMIDKNQFSKATRGHTSENVLIDMKIEKQRKPKKAIIKEIQVHPVSDEIIHIDFSEVFMDEKIHTRIPIVEKGEAKGVKEQGGVLEHIMRDIEIECLPAEIPEKIEIDITDLEVGKSIHVSDIGFPDGTKVLTDSKLVVFSVAIPKVVEEAVPAEGEEEAAAEPEVIGKVAEEEPEEEQTEEKGRKEGTEKKK